MINFTKVKSNNHKKIQKMKEIFQNIQALEHKMLSKAKANLFSCHLRAQIITIISGLLVLAP